MRRVSLVSMLCMFGSIVTPAMGETLERYYDQHGNPRGQLSQEGSRRVIRDGNGNPHGYFEQRGSRTDFRDNNGNLLNYSTHK